MTHLQAAWKLADMGFEICLEEDPQNGKPYWSIFRQKCFVGNYTTPESLVTLCGRVAKRERHMTEDLDPWRSRGCHAILM